MDKTYQPKKFENKIYQLWQKGGYFTQGEKEGKKPFVIIMPPPNANASLHAGHGMYTIDDILIRYYRMKGFFSLWVPGMDHAGFETQFVYEQVLKKEGRSRLDFDRETLYGKIADFVKKNSGIIYQQFKLLGFSADWKRSSFSLDSHVVNQVFATFKKMHADGLVYRDDYLINYCTHCGTTLADLEVKHIQRQDPLYYLKYGPFTLATVRPETKFADTAVAVHPQDKRYQKWVGREIEVNHLIGKVKLKIIADNYVDPNFGSGVVKVTPAHDPADFEVGKKHHLERKVVIDFNGRLTALAGKYAGLTVNQARKKVVEDLKKKGLLRKTDENYLHAVAVCYKCQRDLEPMILPNWFVKVGPLKKKAIEAVKKGQVKFIPGRFLQDYWQWMKIMHDWPISRQIVWGIRIPVWYNVRQNPHLKVTFLNQEKQSVSGEIGQLLAKYRLAEIRQGLQKLIAPKEAVYQISQESPGKDFLPETDTFDTWFSSGQWPLVALDYPAGADFKKYFPTDVMGTLSDILRFWISRMMMFSLYLTGKVPFKTVYLWSKVTDRRGLKMSKSKGNVIDPTVLVTKYGADAFRLSLIFGTSAAGTIALYEDKVRSMRNFTNKIFNIGRFINLQNSKFEIPALPAGRRNSKQYLNSKSKIPNNGTMKQEDKKILNELDKLINTTTKNLDNFQFSKAIEDIYHFLWHSFADQYLEYAKTNLSTSVVAILNHVYLTALALLHPFAPFVTEAVWQQFSSPGTKPLIIQPWPKEE